MNWEQKYCEWKGTAQELAELAKRVMDSIGMNDADVEPNERLVRHYVQLGILHKPERRGRESLFRVHQLAQYLAARNLVATMGLNLSNVADFTSNSDLNGLIDMIPKRISESESKTAKSNIAKIEPAKLFFVEKEKSKQAYEKALQQLGLESPPSLSDFVEIEIPNTCRFQISTKKLNAMTAGELDALGIVISNRLKQFKHN